MKIHRFVFNPIQENTYILWDDTNECIIIDAGNASAAEDARLTDFIAEQGLKPVMAVNTHGHFDHAWGVEYLKSTFGVPFAISSHDAPLLASAQESAAMFCLDMSEAPSKGDIDLSALEELHFGNTTLRIIATPGHSQGGISLFDEDSKSLFVGDTLFRESIGRTDLPGGDYPTIMRSIIGEILPLGDEVTIYPGHGEKTTIGHESLYNPFIVEALNGEINYSL